MKRKTDNFYKFYNRKSTSAVKEEIRQEKKLMKKERGKQLTDILKKREINGLCSLGADSRIPNPAIKSASPIKPGNLQQTHKTTGTPAPDATYSAE